MLAMSEVPPAGLVGIELRTSRTRVWCINYCSAVQVCCLYVGVLEMKKKQCTSELNLQVIV